MKEIESIFERGNEKLVASLEDIRREQVRLFMIIVFALGFVVDGIWCRFFVFPTPLR